PRSHTRGMNTACWPWICHRQLGDTFRHRTHPSFVEGGGGFPVRYYPRCFDGRVSHRSPIPPVRTRHTGAPTTSPSTSTRTPHTQRTRLRRGPHQRPRGQSDPCDTSVTFRRRDRTEQDRYTRPFHTSKWRSSHR